MREFIECSTLLDRPPALRDRFAEDGFVFFRAHLPFDDVTAVREAVLAELVGSGWIDDGGKPTVAPVNERDDDYFPLYGRVQSLEAFHRLAHHPALVDVAGALLGAPVLVHPRKIARITFPDNAFGTTPPHQDYPLIQGTTDVLTAWIALGDCPAEMGGLKILTASNQGGLRTGRPFAAVGHVGVDIADDDPAWASTDYRAGDVLVFHSLTVHGARPNRSPALRLSADFRYQAVAEPMVTDSLHPHYHPDIPDWPVLSEGWTSTAPIEVPAGVRTVDYVSPIEPLLPDPSRFVAVGSTPRPGVVVP